MNQFCQGWKKLSSKRLFMPILCLLAVLLINLITTPDFFRISLNNGVLYGYIIDVIKLFKLKYYILLKEFN